MQPRDDRVVDGKRPKPMASQDPGRITRAWPFFREPEGETPPWAEDEPSLTDAVAAIVGIAAQRARSTGTLDALRMAVEAALRTVPHAAERGAAPRVTRAGRQQASASRG